MRYDRITAKLFGETASATGNDPQIGQFGSAKTGTYRGTGDVSVIQALTAWSNGFIDCVTPTTQFPPLPEMTGVIKVLSYLQCYLLQQGIAAYDPATMYYEGNWCSYEQKLYICINDNSGQGITSIPPTNTINWLEYTFTATRIIGEPQITLDFTSVDPPTNCVWLNGDLKSKTTYANLYAIYRDNYWDGITFIPNGEFQLPNFQNMTIWGGTTPGYISAGLPNITGSHSDSLGRTRTQNAPKTVGCLTHRANVAATGTYSSSGTMYQTFISINAANANSIYGNSTTVQPPVIKIRAYTRYQ